MNLRAINDNLPLPIILVLVGILAALTYHPSPTACFGERTQSNAQQGAEVWLHNRATDPIWTPSVTRRARVQCLSIASGERWAECHIGPVDGAGTNYVVDCDTAGHNNIGCVSSR